MDDEVVSLLSPAWFPFWRRLPPEVRRSVRRSYQTWQSDPAYRRRNGAEYVSPKLGLIYRVVLSQGYRAVARREGNVYRWFFVGTHAEYESLLGLNR